MDFYQWTAIAVVIGLAGGLWVLVKHLLRRLPLFAVNTSQGSDPDAWTAQYRSDWRRGLGEGLIAGLAATVVIAIVLSALAAAIAPEAEARLAPSLLLWLVPGGLLAWPIGHAWWAYRRGRLLGPDRRRELLVARERHVGLQQRPLAWLKGSIATLLGVAAALLLADWHLHVAPNTLTWDSLWRLQGQSYSYADVRAIEALQSRRNWHGDIVREPSYRIRLADGRRWESWRVSHGMTPSELHQVMQLVAQRSGQPLDVLDPYPRGLPAGAPTVDRKTAPSS